MKHFVGPAIVLVLAVLVGCSFVGTNLYYNWGDLSGNGVNISAPLDDTFIHLQYGRQIGEGEWFRYNDGDPVSTGASSFLYALLLGGAHFVGFSDGRLLGFAIVFGAGLFVLAALLSYGLGRRLAGERAGFWSGALISANGAFAWGATSGMEVALFSVLILGTLLAFLRELSSGRFLLTPVLGALTALTRPEGLLLPWLSQEPLSLCSSETQERPAPTLRDAPWRCFSMLTCHSSRGWPSTCSTR